MTTDLIGRTLLKHLQVEAFIASGGMGAVYRVRDLGRNVPLAMKILHNDPADDPVAFKSLQREGGALKKLAHPHIVPFYGLYKEQEFVFLLEGYIDGPSLKTLLARRQGAPLPLEQALAFLKALSAALGYAHLHGVVHCDLKPGNVMLDRGGNIYLTDFGVARHAESATTTLAGAGSPAYMPPEQARGDPVSAATDIYALGVLLFEMLTGRRPFLGSEPELAQTGSTPRERVRYAHQRLMPPDPCQLNPTLPPALGPALLKALAKRPQERYVSTQDFLNAVCMAVGVLPEQVQDHVPPPPVVPPPGGQSTQSASTPRGVSQTNPPTSPRIVSRAALPAVVGAMLLGVTVIVILGLLLLREWMRPPDDLAVSVALTATALSAGRTGGSSGSAALPPAPAKTASATAVSTPTAWEPLVTSTPRASKTSPPTATSYAPAVPSDTPAPTVPPPTKAPPPSGGEKRKNPADGAALIYVPAGSFQMGLTDDQARFLLDMCDNCSDTTIFDASQPVHDVYLDGYWIYRTEVSNAMYAQCVSAGDCDPPASFSSQTHKSYYDKASYANYPVMHVNWDAANRYCHWAGGRLPTEAEWEKAGRGTDGRLFPWGDQLSTQKLANVHQLVGDVTAVDDYESGASPYGVLNMSGNVWEWVADWYAAGYYRQNSDWNNPLGPSSGGSLRSGRGGSWYWSASVSSVGLRDWWQPGKEGSGVGFRCMVPEN